MCPNEKVWFAGHERHGCFLISVASMLSIVLPDYEWAEILHLVQDSRVPIAWGSLRRNMSEAPDRAFQAHSIFLVCCAMLNMPTFLVTASDMGFNEQSDDRSKCYKVTWDGSDVELRETSTPVAEACRIHPAIVVYTRPPPRDDDFYLTGMFLDLYKMDDQQQHIIGGHTAVAQHLDDGRYVLLDSGDSDAMAFSSEEDLYVYTMASYPDTVTYRAQYVGLVFDETCFT